MDNVLNEACIEHKPVLAEQLSAITFCLLLWIVSLLNMRQLISIMCRIRQAYGGTVMMACTVNLNLKLS